MNAMHRQKSLHVGIEIRSYRNLNGMRSYNLQDKKKLVTVSFLFS